MTQNQQMVLKSNHTTVNQEMTVSFDIQRHSERTLHTVIRVRNNVREFRQERQRAVVGSLALYRKITPHVPLCVVVSVYKISNKIITIEKS